MPAAALSPSTAPESTSNVAPKRKLSDIEVDSQPNGIASPSNPEVKDDVAPINPKVKAVLDDFYGGLKRCARVPAPRLLSFDSHAAAHPARPACLEAPSNHHTDTPSLPTY